MCVLAARRRRRVGRLMSSLLLRDMERPRYDVLVPAINLQLV